MGINVLKLRVDRFIRRVGFKNFFLYMLVLLTPAGSSLLIHSARLIFPKQRLLKVILNPLWMATLQHLHVRRLGSNWLCTSLIKRVRFLVRDPGAVRIYSHIWVAEDYEDFARPGKGDVVIDVGAHIGLFTLKCLLKHKCALVVAVEPNPDNMHLLSMNTIINGLSGKVVAVKAAAGARGGRAKLYINTHCSYMHSLIPKKNAPALEVDMITIDEVVAKLKLRKVDFIKVDIEGYELEVIEGAEKTLTSFSPTLVIETNLRNIATFSKSLKKYGYFVKAVPCGYSGVFHVTALPRNK